MTSLAKLFYKKLKLAQKMSEVNSEFSRAMSDTKWSEIDIPDDIVDCIDYGNGEMTFSEFRERMNEELDYNE